MAGVSDQFDPRAYHQPCVRGCDVGCASTSHFCIPIQQRKYVGFTWLEDGERCFMSCSEHICVSFLHFVTIFFFCNEKNQINRKWLSVQSLYKEVYSAFISICFEWITDGQWEVQGDSVARRPKLLSIQNYVIEIMT